MKRKIFFITILLFVVTGLIVKTYSRYSTEANGNGSLQIAKWNVKVNGIPITEENQVIPLSLDNAESVGVSDIAPGKIVEGVLYKIPVEIDASESEVSLDVNLKTFSFTGDVLVDDIYEVFIDSQVMSSIFDSVHTDIDYNLNPNQMKKIFNIYFKKKMTANPSNMDENHNISLNVFLNLQQKINNDKTIIDSKKYLSLFKNRLLDLSSSPFIDMKFENHQDAVNIATDNSKYPVMAYLSSDSIYIYSQAEKIYLPNNSVGFFSKINNLSNEIFNKFDFSYVDIAAGMFRYSNISNLDFSKLKNINILVANFMFANSKNLSRPLSLDIKFEKARQISFPYYFVFMFSGANISVVNIPLSNIYVSNQYDLNQIKSLMLGTPNGTQINFT